MLRKKITTTFRAALVLIATEDVNALRIVLKTITNLTSKPAHVQKKG